MFKKLLMTTSAFGLVGCSLSITGCAQVQLQPQANETEYTHPNFLETLYFNNEMEKALVDFKELDEAITQHTHSVEIGDKSLAFSKLMSSQIVTEKTLDQQEWVFSNQTSTPTSLSQLTNNPWLTLEQKNQIVPAYSQVKQLVQVRQTRRLVRYHYLVPIENDQWCKKVVGASGTVYQITPKELVAATINDPVLLEYYLGENEFYQYKDFIGQAGSPYLVWAATNIDFWVDELTFSPVPTTLTVLSK